MQFTVEVPQKNQQLRVETDKVPTHYDVIWDGMVVLVTWMAPKANLIPLSGGHVVTEVMQDALRRVDLDLYVQGCEPSCEHQFAHTDIRLERDGGGAVLYTEGAFPMEVQAHLPPIRHEDLPLALYLDFRAAATDFARLKNVGRRVLETEAAVRGNLDALMQINYRRSTLPGQPFGERLRRRWEMRKWHRQSRVLIASIWVMLSRIEGLSLRWREVRFELEEGARDHGKRKLFDLDYGSEVDRVESLDLELMRSGVQEIAERLDSRALLRVTVVAAVAGAVAGGAVGGLAGGLF